jgi:hypothetical protein
MEDLDRTQNMNKFCLIAMSIFVPVVLLTAIADCQMRNVKHTKQQRQAAGFWRADPLKSGGVPWLVIPLGDSPETMIVRWPTGIACQDDPAEIHGNKITIGGHFPAVLELNGSNEATLTNGGSTLHLRKTKESTNFVCE